MCREPIRRVARVDLTGRGSRLGRESILQRVDLSKWRTSTKVQPARRARRRIPSNSPAISQVEACFEAIEVMRKKDPEAKALVFSQYRTMLDVVEWRLRLGGHRVAKLTGDLPLAERKSVLARFKADASVAVALRVKTNRALRTQSRPRPIIPFKHRSLSCLSRPAARA